MGMLDPIVAEISGPHLEFAYGYFCKDALPDELDAYVRGFVPAFLRRFPDAAAAPSLGLAPYRWSALTEDRAGQWEGLVDDLLLHWYVAPEYAEGDPVIPYRVTPGFQKAAAFHAIRACCTSAVGGATQLTPLAEDLRWENWGALWHLLDRVCRGPQDREVARLFRKLMLDPERKNEDFPDYFADRLASLLRPAEVARLQTGLAVLRRFYVTIPPPLEIDPEDQLALLKRRLAPSPSHAERDPNEWFRGGLLQVIGVIASVYAEDACLFCASEES